MDAEGEPTTPGAIDIRPTRADAEKCPASFYRLLGEFRDRGLLPLKRIAEISGDTSLNPEPNILRKIQNKTLTDQARAALLSHILDVQSLLFGKARRQLAAVDHSFYFAFLNFLDAKDSIQDEARARIIGTYKFWRYAVDLDDELVLGKLTVSEDRATRALKAQVVVGRQSSQGLRGSRNPFSGYVFCVPRAYFLIARDGRTDDLRMTLFPRFRIDAVGTEINPRSVFAGKRHHVAHMDGLSLGMDGSRAYVSPMYAALVDDADELQELDQLLDVVPHDDRRVPPGVVKRLRRSGPLRVL
jgi:hypothetical protein